MHRRDTHVQLIVFDLDGVLVESKSIHYHALNLALAEVGKEFPIQREEQEHIYEGWESLSKFFEINLLHN